MSEAMNVTEMRLLRRLNAAVHEPKESTLRAICHLEGLGLIKTRKVRDSVFVERTEEGREAFWREYRSAFPKWAVFFVSEDE